MNFHGGDIYEYNKYILDYSSNINPFGVPESFSKALLDGIDDFTHYPDIKYTGLRQNVAEYLNVDNIGDVAVGNGAVELIYKGISASGCKKVIGVCPTFSEYGRAAKLCGKSYMEVPAYKADYQTLDIDILLQNVQEQSLVVICNPNNPTGTLVKSSILCDLINALKNKASYLLLDEAFMEFTDDSHSNTMINEIESFSNLMVVRAATKFFGMPGIRLGYIISSNKKLIADITEGMEPWNVNTAAVIAASSVFKDKAYIEKTKEWIKLEREYLYNQLSSFEKLHVYKSQANFHLLRLENISHDAWSLKEEMIKKGILVRTPDGFNQLTCKHFRLAVKNRASNDRLLQTLREVLQNG